MESASLYEAALSLPEQQRADLAYRLLESLEPAAGLSETSPGFEDELERRMRAYEQGTTTASDWDAVSARLRAALGHQGDS